MSQSPDDETIDAEVVEETSAVAVPDSMAPLAPMTPTALGLDYSDDGVPTFDYVRDQIEGRVATSIGAAELAGDTAPAAAIEDEFAAREQAGRDRLEEIRRSMRQE